MLWGFFDTQIFIQGSVPERDSFLTIVSGEQLDGVFTEIRNNRYFYFLGFFRVPAVSVPVL